MLLLLITLIQKKKKNVFKRQDISFKNQNFTFEKWNFILNDKISEKKKLSLLTYKKSII